MFTTKMQLLPPVLGTTWNSTWKCNVY